MKILIIKTSSLGDIVQVFPVLSYLRNRFPQAQIDWVVEAPFAELVQAHPFINETLYVNTKAWRKSPLRYFHEILLFRQALRKTNYEYVFDLQGNIKSGLILSQVKGTYKIGFAKDSVAECPNLFFTNSRYTPPQNQNIRDDYLFIVKEFFRDSIPYIAPGVALNVNYKSQELVGKIIANISSPIFMVCPGSAWRNKQMTEEALIDFLKHIQEDFKCYFLITWGSKEEKELAEKIAQNLPASKVIDRLPLSVLQKLMSEMDLIIAMDSLPLHLAGTTSTRTFSIFGASSAQKYQPSGKGHYALQGTCPYGQTFVKRCPLLRSCSTGSCIRKLSGDEVYEAFKRVFL